MKECNCARCNGDGPPDDYDEPEPETETIHRFRRPRIIDGKLYAEYRMVEVDPETHKVIKYLRVERRLCWRLFTNGAEIRKWAARHPRVGPKYLVALEAIK